MSCAVAIVASLAVHSALPAQAFAPARPDIPIDALLLHRSADSGVDIVRMPPRLLRRRLRGHSPGRDPGRAIPPASPSPPPAAPLRPSTPRR